MEKMEKQFLPVNNYKGTRDFYPDDMLYRNWFFSKVKKAVEGFGFEEYNAPLLESFEIYAAKSGEEIAGEQLYTFTDKGERRLAIRPEMTPSVARMVAAKLDALVFPLRWFSIANFMRYEKPQKGRLREHWQVNVDIFGSTRPECELEIFAIIDGIMREFKADKSMFRIRVNNRKFFNDVISQVIEADATQVKLISKAVDKRAKISKETYDAWLSELGISAKQIEILDEIFSSSYDQIKSMLTSGSEGASELDSLFSLLDQAGLGGLCEFDFSIVRGFDYYTGTVFEVYDTSLENRRSLFGGGRYDNLVNMFRDNAVSGIGFGLGDVTFQHFLAIHDLIPDTVFEAPKVYITRFADVPLREYYAIANELRTQGIPASVHFTSDEKLGKQMGLAEKKRYPIVLIAGADEIAKGTVAVKHLGMKQQFEWKRSELARNIKALLSGEQGAV
jgi:histidyl-tRNA synthetase